MDTNHEKVPEIKIEQGTPEDYNRRAEFWERTEKKIQSDFLCRPYVYELLGDIKDRAVVDIGCGDGFVSRHLAREGARVVGLDNSEGQIDKAIARETKEGLGINYLVGDARELPMRDESVDSAVSVLVYGHFPKSEMIKAIQETYRVLKPGGTFVVAVPHPETYLKKSKSNWIKFNYDNLKDGDDQRANITLYNSDGRSFTIDAWVQRYQT
ncbi:MAG: class I SAM-dependent methyltransferase, partial [Candidatus Wolfebacteria bacterium]|nr:class I SAM-dependent methyltransferase [Candidatus Wolfebacteria bacterium]